MNRHQLGRSTVFRIETFEHRRLLAAGALDPTFGGGDGVFIGPPGSTWDVEAQANGKIVGTLGVIGPTRMAYERVIPIVDITSRLLSNALSNH